MQIIFYITGRMCFPGDKRFIGGKWYNAEEFFDMKELNSGWLGKCKPTQVACSHINAHWHFNCFLYNLLSLILIYVTSVLFTLANQIKGILLKFWKYFYSELYRVKSCLSSSNIAAESEMLLLKFLSFAFIMSLLQYVINCSLK